MRRFVLNISMVLAGSLTAAQTDYNVGSTSAPWLNVEASPRAAALAGQGAGLKGDALIALADDPAALASLTGQSLAVAQNNWIQDTSLQQAVYGLGLGNAGGLALGFTYMNYGSLDKYAVLNDGTVQAGGSFSPYGYAVKLGYGLPLSKFFSFGLAGKYISESIDSLSSSAFTGDAGLQLNTQGFTLGISGSNLFGTLHEANLPTQLKAAASYDLVLGTSSSLKLLAGLGLPTADGSALNAGGGLEYGLSQAFWGRVGYRWQANGIEGLNGLSAGFGLKYKLVSLDYAYVALGELGSGNQVGLKLEF